jgi:hypothetical protein
VGPGQESRGVEAQSGPLSRACLILSTVNTAERRLRECVLV